MLVLLALLPAWGLAGGVAWHLAASERRGLTREAEETARGLTVTVERELAVLHASLGALATSPALASGDLEGFHRQATRFQGTEGVQVCLVDAEGRLLLDTTRPFPPEPGQRLPEGAPPEGLSGVRVMPGSGRPAVLLTERVPMQGQASPVALSILTDSVWFWSDSLRRAGLPPHWRAAVLDASGRIVARFPDPRRYIGEAVQPETWALLRADATALRGWLPATSLDGAPLYATWQRLPGPGWTVLVGVPREAIDGALTRSLTPVLVGGLLLLLALTAALIFWAGRRLARPLQALERAAVAAGQGGLSLPIPPSGVRELDAVARALVVASGERRVREAESARLSARLRAVLDHVPVGVALVEAGSGQVVLGNRRLTELLGHAVIGAPLGRGPEGAGVLHPDGSLRRLELGQALASGQSQQGEFRYRRPDGQVRWLRGLVAPIRDEASGAAGAVVAVADIDAERRAVDALRQSELRFRTLAEAVPHLVWTTDAAGRLDYVNPFFYRFSGLEPGLPHGHPVVPMHPEDRPAAAAAWQRALASGEPYAAEYRLRRADGEWRWFTAHALLARDAEGDPGRWIGTAVDVTELIETRQALEAQVESEAMARQLTLAAAEALRISETRFRRFAEASPDLLWILDRESGRLEYLSPAYAEIWGEGPPAGCDAEAALRQRLHPEDAAQVAAALAGLQDEAPVDVEYRIGRADGEVRWVRVMSFPIRDAADRVTRIGGFARDVTARRQADERQRLLIGELNHRVKNTLATVLAISRHTAQGADQGAELRAEAAAGARPEGRLFVERFLADFQARLMALARGHDLLTARTWQGAPLCEVATSALRPWQAEPGAEPRLRIDGPAVMLAPKQALGLALAFHELATNASKHGALSTPEGRVQLSWKVDAGGGVELEWIESGGPVTVPPKRRGFGSRLLERGLPVELGPGAIVEMNYGSDGVSARIRFRPSQEGAVA